MILSTECLEAFKAHVLGAYPEEACGFVVDGNFRPITNTSQTPLETFRIDPVEYARAAKAGEVQAVLHSHPYKIDSHPQWPVEWPSEADMNCWMAGNLPWGIASTEGEGISEVLWLDDSVVAPLEGREFVHGVYDCYSVIRDWYRLNKQITLPNYARNMDWWHSGQDLYSANFEHAGFKSIPYLDADVGDVILIQLRSPVPNHAGVVVGPNQLLHHKQGRLSGVEQLSKWASTVHTALRYVGKQC